MTTAAVRPLEAIAPSYAGGRFESVAPLIESNIRNCALPGWRHKSVAGRHPDDPVRVRKPLSGPVTGEVLASTLIFSGRGARSLRTSRAVIESKAARPGRLPIFIFDIGGVIIRWRNNDPIFKYLAERYDLPYAEVKRACARRLSSLESGKISITAFVNDSLHDLGRSLKRRDSATRLWVLPLERLCRPKLGMINYVRMLRRDGYSVYALTNVSSPHLDFFRRTGLAAEFDRTFASSELGCVKPNREIYQKVFRRLHASPAEAVFVDDRVKNVKGARDYGIRWAFRFKSISQLKRDVGRVLRESEPPPPSSREKAKSVSASPSLRLM